jgi:NTP pyrophosphatase (non-canonical NTP hydrolase)
MTYEDEKACVAALDDLRQKADALDNDAIAKEFIHDHLASLYTTIMGNGIWRLESRIVEYRERKQFKTNWSNVPEKLMLVVTELAEAMEAYRHMKRDADDVPVRVDDKWYENFAEELADAIIRLLDLTGSLCIDIESRIAEKMATNEMRPIKHGKTC